MSANTHDDTPQPTRPSFMERKGKLEELDRSFDLKFWQAQDDTVLGIHKPQVTD